MTIKKFDASMTTTRQDCRYFVWFLGENVASDELDTAQADLWKTPAGAKNECTAEVEVDNFLYVYVWFPYGQYQPGTAFSLDVGSVNVYEDESAENHEQPNAKAVLASGIEEA